MSDRLQSDKPSQSEADDYKQKYLLLSAQHVREVERLERELAERDDYERRLCSALGMDRVDPEEALNVIDGLREVARPSRLQQWIPCSDSTPPPGHSYLVMDCGVVEIASRYTIRGVEGWSIGDDDGIADSYRATDEITHWMPLPPSPGEVVSSPLGEREAAALHACEGLATVDLARNGKGWLNGLVHDAAHEEVKLNAALRSRCPGNGDEGDPVDCQSYEASEQGSPCPPGCCVMAEEKDVRAILAAIELEEGTASSH